MFILHFRILICLVLGASVLTACSYADPEDKYELKSPCVANEQSGHAATPCVRRPINAPNLG